MDPFGSTRNYQLLSVLAQRICSLAVCLIAHVRQEYAPVQHTLRQALLPMHRVLTDFLFDTTNASEQSCQQRGAPHSFVSLPSMPNYFHQPSFYQPSAGCFPPCRGSITPLEDITPSDGTPPRQSHWVNTPLGYTSTPLRSPTVRSQPEPFALINQLLTVIRTSNDCNLSNVTEQYANDPIFRDRALRELDELRSFIAPQPGEAGGGAGQAVRALLDRVEQAEITLSLLINNLEQLQKH